MDGGSDTIKAWKARAWGSLSPVPRSSSNAKNSTPGGSIERRKKLTSGPEKTTTAPADEQREMCWRLEDTSSGRWVQLCAQGTVLVSIDGHVVWTISPERSAQILK